MFMNLEQCVRYFVRKLARVGCPVIVYKRSERKSLLGEGIVEILKKCYALSKCLVGSDFCKINYSMVMCVSVRLLRV